ncbi:hypothetical protein Ato02nite_064750 [Paractinoplanes toevensis]|uniref:Uncharacterized protein n=1 Tax=Paractinoplanes toevensis TaxID=571911 RepID=A0A919W3E6_9ACTN|nr:hypothetical protein Ato02nite_064750 [Actinoplanes toevensis]
MIKTFPCTAGPPPIVQGGTVRTTWEGALVRYPDGFARKEDPVNVFPFIAAEQTPPPCWPPPSKLGPVADTGSRRPHMPPIVCRPGAGRYVDDRSVRVRVDSAVVTVALPGATGK